MAGSCYAAGINLGDVAVETGDLFGEGVIVAVRFPSMAEPGLFRLRPLAAAYAHLSTENAALG